MQRRQNPEWLTGIWLRTPSADSYAPNHRPLRTARQRASGQPSLCATHPSPDLACMSAAKSFAIAIKLDLTLSKGCTHLDLRFAVIEAHPGASGL